MSSFQPFHLLNPSPWPIIVSIMLYMVVSSMALFFNYFSVSLTLVAPFLFVVLSALLLQWFRDILRESTFEGSHLVASQTGFKWGMILFISSECTLFLSFFWGYFHFSLSSLSSTGLSWPPAGLSPCHTFDIPLLNTVLLVSSGLTVTSAHHYICSSNFNMSVYTLGCTLVLGVYFLSLQALEFSIASFSFMDSAFGGIFFLSSGAHGMHVLLGVILLTYSFIRLISGQFSEARHLSFEFSAWYWHFVDVVWLFLFSLYYWWGS